MIPRIAVILFPGINCENETASAVRSVGMEAKVVRWNSVNIEKYDGFIIPGGFSYEDRVRAGVISARDPIMELVKEQSEQGKPVLGICNGAQILVESGLVPGFSSTDMALAPNINPLVSGYYCTWVYVKSSSNVKNAFNLFLGKNEVFPLPIAHGEGRFVTQDTTLLYRLEENEQIALKYSTEKGETLQEFPTNPNGSVHNLAGLCNEKGNIMAMMPHPERANWKRQVPGFRGSFMEAEHPGPGRRIFASMKRYIEQNVYC